MIRTLQTQLVRWIYHRRRYLKWIVFVRKPVLLRLPDFKLYVRLDDWAVGARIALRRQYEPHVVAVMRPYLRPGLVVVDIGANIGYYALLAATQVGPTGKVIAFEPGPSNCRLLQQSIAANGLRNVILHASAVGDAPGQGWFSGESNGSVSAEFRQPTSLPVQVVVLDQVLAGESRIDLIKMDIEGGEGRALKGMSAILARHRPIIFSEFSPGALPRISGVTPEAYLARWRAAGYMLYTITQSTGRSAGPQSDAEIMAHFSPRSELDHIDLLALPVECAA
jgi:FkbM family methyltransferase